MKKISIVFLTLVCVLAFVSCSKGSKVAQAAADIEEIANDMESLSDDYPESFDMTNESDAKKIEELTEKSNKLNERGKELVKEYSFIKESSMGGFEIDEDEFDKLSDSEKADRSKLDESFKKLAEVSVKLLQKAGEATKKTVGAMDDNSSSNELDDFGLDENNPSAIEE